MQENHRFRLSIVGLCYDVIHTSWVTAMATLTMRIDERMEAELSRLAESSHRTKSDLAREMLRRQIAIQRFHALRKEAVPYAEAAGYLTDEDVFRDAS